MSVPVASFPIKPSSATLVAPIKLVAFEVGKLNLAVRIDQVQKVVNLPTVYGSGLNPIGLARVGDREITVVDLARRLFHADANRSGQYGYLVLVQQRTGEIFGIPSVETPLLLEVPANLIRTLPPSYRRADTLEIASHIAIIPGAEASRTLFLLDVEMLSVEHRR